MIETDSVNRVHAGRSYRWVRTVLGAVSAGLGISGVIFIFLQTLEARRGVEGIAGGPAWVPMTVQALILFGALLVAWPQRSRQRLHSKQPARPSHSWLRAALAVSLIILAVMTGYGGSLLSDTTVALWPVSFTLGPILLAAGIIIAAGPQQHTTEPQAATARQQAQRAKANLHPGYWIGLPAVAGSIAGVILGHLLPSLDLLTPVIGTIFGATAGTAVYTARQQSPTHTTSDRQPDRDPDANPADRD